MASQDLNKSRFLFEELNLDEQPTEQEVLERAQELDIQDLNLARESLTKELDPQWKPYCNRKGQVYYINLLTRKAYVDHPIDMYYQELYAKQNQLPIPKFSVYKIQQIAQSIHLIEDEIRELQNLNTGHRGLNIVYEEPSQEDLQSCARSPSHYNQNVHFQEPQQELSPEQAQELFKFEAQLASKLEQQFFQNKKAKSQKLETLIEDSQQRIKQLLKNKIEEQCYEYQIELKKKNKIEQEKILCKIQKDRQQLKNSETDSNIARFKELVTKFREKQKNFQKLYEEKQSIEKLIFLEKMNDQQNITLEVQLQKLKKKSIAQFDRKLIQLAGTSAIHQKQLKRQLNNLFDSFQPTPIKKNTFYKTKQDNQKFVDINKNTQYQSKRNQKVLSQQNWYDQTLKNIKTDSIWSQYNITTSIEKTKCRMPLSTRLQLKIL